MRLDVQVLRLTSVTVPALMSMPHSMPRAMTVANDAMVMMVTAPRDCRDE
ncbi:MAG: hypothetical protein NW205_02255 [Hyphomicrobiaceae bacterium]|jgi:hypothetical protein|nr:hypothetical protein [Hyphomicrobiaceae bacterium]